MFKRFFVAIITIIILLSGCSKTLHIIDWVDFVNINGIQYLRYNDSLDEDQLGSKIGEVKFKVSGNVNDPKYKDKEGDAAFLEKGTPIYMVRGYKSSFRIAVQESNNISLYQVSHNPSAKQGSDLVDITNRIEYIRISDDNYKELATIRDSQEINEMVDTILQAPVNISSSEQIGKRYFIFFHLKDGSDFKGAYWLETGQFYGMDLPVEFGIFVKEALIR